MRRGATIWFTGLPCSGKSTLAELLEKAILDKGHFVEVLDGDVVRKAVNSDLGFSKKDRDTNVKRIGFICQLLSRNGVFAIAALVSPYRTVRQDIRNMVGDNFIEVYVRCAVEECIRRDVKGMYKKALAGEIKEFTGVSDPYEASYNPELIVDTEHDTQEACLNKIISLLAFKELV